MADRLTVDLDGLSQFAARLRRIQERLDEAKQELGEYGAALGDARVSSALDDFEQHWRDGRKKVSDNAEALSTMVGEAVKTYRATDDRLRDEIAAAGRELASRTTVARSPAVTSAAVR